MTVSVQQLAARQIRLWEALKADRKATPAVAKSRRPVITISRQAGIDVAGLVDQLAQRLGYGVWDQEIIDYVASTSGIRKQLIESLEEQMQSALERWVEGAIRGHLFDADDYSRALVHVLRALGEQGGVIVVGRGSNQVMPPDRSVRVRLVAPLEWRAGQNCALGESLEDAGKRLADADQKRHHFVKSIMKADPDDPVAFDLILNVERIPLDAQIRMILEALHSRF